MWPATLTRPTVGASIAVEERGDQVPDRHLSDCNDGTLRQSARVDQLNALQSALTVPGSDLVTPREAGREPTRERIVAAAVQSLVEDGYAVTTTLRVQHRAGVSRGAL